MKKHLRTGCLGCLLVLLPFFLSAREGFNTAFKISLSKPLGAHFYFLAEEDIRPDTGFGHAEWSLSTFEVNYRLTPFLRLGTGYMLMARLYRSDGLRNRYYFYATASHSAGRFTFSLRERFQSTYRHGGTHPQNYLRSMLTLSYRLPRLPLSPFVYIEPFHNTGYKGRMHTDKIRLSTGCDYRLNPQNVLQLYYRYHIFNVSDPLNYRHALGVTYSHRF